MKLPLLSGREVVAALKRMGFVELHRKGSHVKMRHPDGRVIVFPYHDEVDRFTLKAHCAMPTLTFRNSLLRYDFSS